MKGTVSASSPLKIVNGKIKVPDVVKPLTLDPNDPARKDPGVKALIERIEQVKTELFGF